MTTPTKEDYANQEICHREDVVGDYAVRAENVQGVFFTGFKFKILIILLNKLQLMKLQKVEIKKYKSINSDQVIRIEDDTTILVGMNESGKTSILEAIAKTNYFNADSKFRFNLTHDYPRKEKKQIDKDGSEPVAVIMHYSIEENLIKKINIELGANVWNATEITISYKYKGGNTWGGIKCNHEAFWEYQLKKLELPSDLRDKFNKIVSKEKFEAELNILTDEGVKQKVTQLSKFFVKEWPFANQLEEYIVKHYLRPNIPKFLYYDEYYALPSEITIEDLNEEEIEDEYKTAKALFELADINTNELINAKDFEDYKAELEATQATISDELFKYWSSNQNLEINFDIEPIIESSSNSNGHIDKIVSHILHIRVKNKRSAVSLPLRNRSKGFNWFFSFLIWFKKIQEDKNSKYILLLDEPGLNLHASAQADLMKFIEDLTADYQIVYTTHSPFMIDSNKLSRVRTVLETKEGTSISESLQEKDPKTLFPLQAALGYDIAQNLFISKKNLIVEGIADLVFLETVSGILQSKDRTALSNDITIVPVGGLDKVATFISLLRGSKLHLVCLLDSFNDAKAKARLDNLIREKIIKENDILFYDEFSQLDKADLEDMFSKEEYLNIYNEAFKDSKLKASDLNKDIPNIIIQINNYIGKDRYNHYLPAIEFAKKTDKIVELSEATLSRFEGLFSKINQLFNK